MENSVVIVDRKFSIVYGKYRLYRFSLSDLFHQRTPLFLQNGNALKYFRFRSPGSDFEHNRLVFHLLFSIQEHSFFCKHGFQYLMESGRFIKFFEDFLSVLYLSRMTDPPFEPRHLQFLMNGTQEYVGFFR